MILYELPPHLQKFAETFVAVLYVIASFLLLSMFVIILTTLIVELKNAIKKGRIKK